jgi:hypothetical protein
MKSWPTITGDLADYVDKNWLRDSPLKRRLREETAKLPQAGMQISAHPGQQMAGEGNRRPSGGRGRHLHRLLGAVRRRGVAG